MVTQSGGAGNDSFTGIDNQNDSLSGNGGADTLIGLGGNDTLIGGSGNDSLVGGAGIDRLDGGIDNDLLNGGADNDVMIGGSGNDTFLGGAGNDNMSGGVGFDTLDYSASTAAVSVNLDTNAVSGGDAAADTISGMENVIGSNSTVAGDTLTGSNLANFISGGAGNDTILGQMGSDSILGGDGNDSITAGPDTIPAAVEAQNLTFDWTNFGGDGTGINDLTTTTVGGINVTVNYARGGGQQMTVATDMDLGTNGNQPFFNTGNGIDGTGFDLNSGVELLRNSGNNGQLSELSLNFASATPTTVSNEVQNVQFLVNDIDRDTGAQSGNTYTDRLKIFAFDENGNPVNVTIERFGNNTAAQPSDATSGQTHTLTGVGQSLAGSSGESTIRVTINGPVSQVVIQYDSANSNGIQFVDVSDVKFRTIPVGAGGDDDTVDGGNGSDFISGGVGNDSLLGGAGNDNILGGLGNDTLANGSGNDTLNGGAGSDLFRLTAPGAGNTTGTVIGGEDTPANDNDVIDLGVGPRTSTVVFDANSTAGDLSGTVFFFDALTHAAAGSMTFDQIEGIICFTPGTLIETDHGPLSVENLHEGDRVMTRDNGYQQVRWIGRRDLDQQDLAQDAALHPVLIPAGSLGDNLPERDLLVSPAHRMLVSSTRATLYFEEPEVLVAARHLVGHAGVKQVLAKMVSYIHFMFDRHEVVRANGAWAESFLPGPQAVANVDTEQRAELFKLFPDLAGTGRAGFAAARRVLKRHESRLLIGGR